MNPNNENNSAVVRLSSRTKQLIDSFDKTGPKTNLPPVNIVESPWHKGFQNKEMQKSLNATITTDTIQTVFKSNPVERKKLEKCQEWMWRVPLNHSSHDSDDIFVNANDNARDGENAWSVHYADDKRRIPNAYKKDAERILSIQKLKDTFGDNWTSVYYNLQDASAILAQPDDVCKKSFDRFVKSQIKEVDHMFADKTEDYHKSLIETLKRNLEADYESGEYLKYAEDVIGQFPGGVAIKEKAKGYIKEYNDEKKHKCGLDNDAINKAMGGSSNSKFAENGGIFVVEFDSNNDKSQSDIGRTLMHSVKDVSDYVGETIGEEEQNYEQRVFISKDVNVADNKKAIVVLYTGFNGDKSAVDDAMRSGILETIHESGIDSGMDISIGQTYDPLESQIANAKERYTTETGSWMSAKSLNRPIDAYQSLDEGLLPTKENENQMDYPSMA